MIMEGWDRRILEGWEKIGINRQQPLEENRSLINESCLILDKEHNLIRIPDTTCNFKDVTFAHNEGQHIMAHSVIMDSAGHFHLDKHQ